MSKKITRCAVYTRKSSEEGLEQDFNSLDAQREAGEAYIKSQKHEGWELITTKYDDGGYSGGNMERPALKQLLTDIEAGKIDVIVVYKVDRLSRALSDFAKMVEVFDKYNVSFVSVTQQFNTTTSMGRLTLNVLLSFAQFEREVTGERIRDKFAASKKKGMWMGGPVPLGYDVKDRKLVINESEADIIKYIYTRYIERSDSETLPELLEELKSKGYRNKSYTSQKGNYIIGKDFTLSQIHKILSNPIYIGKIKHKDKLYDGEQQPIITQEQWTQVQEKSNKHSITRNKNRQSERGKLFGKLWDYHGNRMASSYSYKYSNAGRYKMKYYLNQEIYTKGKTSSEFKRIRSDHLDKIITEKVLEVIENLFAGLSKSENKDVVSSVLKYLHDSKFAPEQIISKVVLYPEHSQITLRFKGDELMKPDVESILGAELTVITEENDIIVKLNLPIIYRKFGGKLCIIQNGEKQEAEITNQNYYPEDKTFIFIAKGFYWSKLIREGVYKCSREIAEAQKHSIEYVKRALRQRYLSPDMITHITSNENDKKHMGVDQLINMNNWDWCLRSAR